MHGATCRTSLSLLTAALLLTGLTLDAGAREAINYATVFSKASPAVVVVVAIQGNSMSRGTGTIIDRSGLVLTNTHVITERGQASQRIQVYLKPARLTGNANKDLHLRYQARLVAMHNEYDIALLQIIRPPDKLMALPLSDLKGVGTGEPTAAIGHPGGGALWSLTTGKISAAYEDYRGIAGYHVFQTETAINPGNSGGPLLDGSGAIIGVNTFIVRVNSDGIPLVGLSFAVKSTTVRAWIKDVIGKLPSVTQLAAHAPPAQKITLPTVAQVKEAKPHVPARKVATSPKAPKAAQWVAPAKKSGARKLFEPRPFKRSKGGYSSKMASGQTILGQELQRLLTKTKKSHRKKQHKLNRLMDSQD